MNLKPWKRSNLLTATRTFGQIALHKNGTQLDVLLRVDGELRWYAVHADTVRQFLAAPDKEVVLPAESDGNAEEGA